MKNLILILAIGFVACGSNAKSDNQGNVFDPEQETTMTLSFSDIGTDGEKHDATNLIQAAYIKLVRCEALFDGLPENYNRLLGLRESLRITLQEPEDQTTNCVDNLLGANLMFVNMHCDPSIGDVAWNLLDMIENKQFDDDAVKYLTKCGF